MAKKQEKKPVTKQVKKERKEKSMVGKSGIGLTLAEMSEGQFKRHLGRVLDRMRSHNVSAEALKDAEGRVLAKRAKAITSVAATAVLILLAL